MRLQKLISNINPEHFNLGKYRMVKITHTKAISSLQWSQIDGIFVENESLLKEVLMDDNHFLKPLFYIGNTDRQCDGICQDTNDPSLIKKMDFLLPSIENYHNIPLPSERQDRLMTKIARYLITRKINIQPKNSRYSKIGYSYPLIEDMSLESEPIHILKNLNQYASNDFLQAQIIDKVNVCYECQGSFLNFSECCTKCNSLDLTTEELVHHFRCAYVGPQSDFMKEEKLICPKCDHQLKHIGIDYDKPSEIHTCKSCNHSSQETKMKAKCIDCCKENELDQLSTFEIYTYSPTEKLKAFASQEAPKQVFGSVDSKTTSLFLNMGAFNLLKSHESKREKPNHLNSYEMILSIHPSLINQLNKGMQLALTEELASIINPYLKSHDLITVDEQNNIIALLIDYQTSEVNNILDILHYNLNKMLKDNGWGNEEMVSISTNPIKI